MSDVIDKKNIPQHIAIIMDGNGRWAQKKGKSRIFGHKNGVESVRATAETCAELNVKNLTLYAFSTENWNRPRLEVSALMKLLVQTLKNEIATLNKNNIRLMAIGELNRLPKPTYHALLDGIENTKHNDRMNLILALNYSARWDIIHATKQISSKIKSGELKLEEIDHEVFESHLSTSGIPDPELLIRTSGEMRLSNFLLWESAYTEFYFCDVFWPDFTKDQLYKAICSYQQRERRFGKTSEQLTIT
jgi:undecaprenyl diphosphate synthase